MKVAAITVTYNDGYKLKEWHKYYLEYKDDLFIHIIVDNGSEDSYFKEMASLFTESIILKRGANGGSTRAYNDGIKFALENKEVDAIMLIGNDIKLCKNGVKGLYNTLKSNSIYGMVEPVLLSKDSNIIEDYGNDVSRYLQMKTYAVGKKLSELKGDAIREVFTVTGGMNMASRSFYETVGLQDENLFMYSDEVDMGLRAKRCGYKMAVTRTVQAWHQHINPNGKKRREVYTLYLMGRNKVYLALKHFGHFRQVEQFMYHFYIFLKGFLLNLLNPEMRNYYLSFLKGSWNGLIGNMSLIGIIKNVDR